MTQPPSAPTPPRRTRGPSGGAARDAGRAILRRELTAGREENITIVAGGAMVTLTGAHAARHNARPDVVHLPIKEAPSVRWGLVWRTQTENDLVRGLAGAVQSLGMACLRAAAPEHPNGRSSC
ncbi:hypothetical protein ACGFSI_19630 [Streptomyces virginiae]|uniref:hypothetical protein n=1 Tax=Streptomyces virginiae TaxID=1961 RepID=UPI00371FF618